jgi:hypothetical protein
VDVQLAILEANAQSSSPTPDEVKAVALWQLAGGPAPAGFSGDLADYDLNNDGKVNVTDVILALQTANGF